LSRVTQALQLLHIKENGQVLAQLKLFDNATAPLSLSPQLPRLLTSKPCEKNNLWQCLSQLQKGVIYVEDKAIKLFEENPNSNCNDCKSAVNPVQPISL
jgi:hypothetical protein